MNPLLPLTIGIIISENVVSHGRPPTINFIMIRWIYYKIQATMHMAPNCPSTGYICTLGPLSVFMGLIFFAKIKILKNGVRLPHINGLDWTTLSGQTPLGHLYLKREIFLHLKTWFTSHLWFWDRSKSTHVELILMIFAISSQLAKKTRKITVPLWFPR